MNTEVKLNWAILVSRWGCNAKDVITAYSLGEMKRSKISLLIYEAEPCGAAQAGIKASIETLRLERNQYENSQIMIAEINDMNLKQDEELSKVLTEDQIVILHKFQLEQRKEKEFQARKNNQSRNSNSSRSSNRSRRRQY